MHQTIHHPAFHCIVAQLNSEILGFIFSNLLPHTYSLSLNPKIAVVPPRQEMKNVRHMNCKNLAHSLKILNNCKSEKGYDFWNLERKSSPNFGRMTNSDLRQPSRLTDSEGLNRARQASAWTSEPQSLRKCKAHSWVGLFRLLEKWRTTRSGPWSKFQLSLLSLSVRICVYSKGGGAILNGLSYSTPTLTFSFFPTYLPPLLSPQKVDVEYERPYWAVCDEIYLDPS